MLCFFIEEEQLEIDNNLVENEIRPAAVGKKNWHFIGDAEAGERSADIFTVIEACRRRSIDPFEYLRDVFTRMQQMAAKNYSMLAPAAWETARQTVEPEKKDRTHTRSIDLQRRCA
jgi:transposase